VMVEIVSGLSDGDQVTLTDPGKAASPAPSPGGAGQHQDRARSGRSNSHVLQPR